MIKKLAVLVIPFILLQSCLKDPDPLTDTIDTYHFYYNYLLEDYGLQWEINETVIGSGHSYGVPAEAVVSLNEPEEKVLIQVRDDENSQLIDSLSNTMYEYGAFMIALLGTEEEPHLLCEAMDTRTPSAGRVKFRFLHATESMGPVDVYIGEGDIEVLALEGFDYTQVSEYLEATEQQLWTSVVLTPAGSLPADSTILEYTANNVFQSGRIYLCTIAHSNNSSESAYEIQVDDQPIF